MGKYAETDNIVLLFDNYGPESRKLHQSFLLAGKKYPVFIMEDDGFLPDGVASIYEYFLGDFQNAAGIPGKPRYFNQITVPDFWEISGNNSHGQVHHLHKERARIFYAEPKHKRLVKVVDWYDDRGVVRSSDHYNKYGALFARTVFNHKGQKVNRSYFSAEGKEIIVENYVTNDIILNDGPVVKIFRTKKELAAYVLKKAGYGECRLFFNTLSHSFFVSNFLGGERKEDLLFWQEPVGEEIPGNMRLIFEGSAPRAVKVLVQRRDAYEKLLALGAPLDKIQYLGHVYPFAKENRGVQRALICTNSDNIAQLEYIVKSLPELQFTIIALTEMSSKLMDMGRYENVLLYPGVKMAIAEKLFDVCDYYLDINHEGEILDAVEKAFLHDHLITAFKETLHNPAYVAKEHIYGAAEADKLVAFLKKAIPDTAFRKQHLELQKQWAGLENEEAYTNL